MVNKQWWCTHIEKCQWINTKQNLWCQLHFHGFRWYFWRFFSWHPTFFPCQIKSNNSMKFPLVFARSLKSRQVEKKTQLNRLLLKALHVRTLLIKSCKRRHTLHIYRGGWCGCLEIPHLNQIYLYLIFFQHRDLQILFCS